MGILIIVVDYNLVVSSSVQIQICYFIIELPFYNDDMWSVMLSRKSSSGADLTTKVTTQNITI